jgi:hypothetical protein
MLSDPMHAYQHYKITVYESVFIQWIYIPHGCMYSRSDNQLFLALGLLPL